MVFMQAAAAAVVSRVLGGGGDGGGGGVDWGRESCSRDKVFALKASTDPPCCFVKAANSNTRYTADDCEFPTRRNDDV
jgi:hypothetical protein